MASTFAEETLEVLPIPSATELVATQLRSLIYSGQLAQGTRLNLGRLASTFNVSKTPLRDAAWILNREGIVEVVPRVGVFVRAIDATEVLEIYELKRSLEPLMAAWGAERGALLERRAFAESCQLLDQAAAAGDIRRFSSLVDDRRATLIRMAASKVLRDTFSVVDGRVRLLPIRILSKPGALERSATQQRRIAKAIRRGDPLASYRAMSTYMTEAAQRVRVVLLEEERSVLRAGVPDVQGSPGAVREPGGASHPVSAGSPGRAGADRCG